MKLPDCVIAATAITLNATLLSTDSQLLRLDWPGLRVAFCE
jgi:predicted nucleic acid-binding protein